ncbi:MAG: glutamate formimidoyltransferase [Anaerolineales bacterium]
MSSPLVECIPNFSEGRRPEVVEAIKRAIADVRGVYVLDFHMDEDHNRSVITFVGLPDAVEEAAFRAISKAAQLIDLNEHEGEHPRIGATDVVPFVPISGVSMEDCVEIAHRLGERVGTELAIPVYLYEEAATRPGRRRLEDVRRGEYEGLKQEIGADPEREPDYGPLEMGPAGATVVGAREFLIAYNVYLSTEDKAIADKIARAVRRSSGGLRYVKALGMLVDGRAQVSMNLTNFRKTPLARVVEFIRREAARYGVGIHHSELVGLIPQDALVDAAVWYTQMDQFEPDQVLERKLYAALERGQEGDFLEELAAGTPTPGGGSAAAQAGAMGACLVAMVVRTTLGKSQYEGVEGTLETVLEESEKLRGTLVSAVEEDAAAFKAVMEAYRLPSDDPDRAQTIQRAMSKAACVPLQVARDGVRVMELALEVAEKGNVNAITDAATGLQLASAAVKSAGYNVRINLQSLEDQETEETLLSELEELEGRAAQVSSQLDDILRERAELS